MLFAESFLRPAMREIPEESADDSIPDRLGKYSLSAFQRLEDLSQQVPRFSVDGFTLAEDLQEAVTPSSGRAGESSVA